MAKSKSKVKPQVMKSYTLRIPAGLYISVKMKLVKEDRKLQPVLIEMLEKYVK